MISPWPVYREEHHFEEEESAVELMKEAVRRIRDVRSSHNVPPSKKANVFIVSGEEDVLKKFREAESFFGTLAHAESVSLQKTKENIDDDAFSAIIPGAVIYIPFADLIDIDKERERLTKERERLTKEIARSNGMLGNEKFLQKAPEKKVQEERDKLENYRQMMAQVEERLAQLEKN